jgi:hypothetical protein
METCLEHCEPLLEHTKIILNQVKGILYKNYCNHMSSKKKLLGNLIMPIIVSVIYAICERISCPIF